MERGNSSRSAQKPGAGENASTKRNSLPDRQKETAQYLADLILELRVLAKSAQLYHDMVPLEYAYYEAFSAANKVEIPEEEAARLVELSSMAEQSESPDGL